jgi:four helix bundle protein
VDLDVDLDVNYMNFRKLDVYQIAVRFLPLAVSIADSLPSRYAAMADQLRRASLSISLNIAEGSGKSTGPDQRRFYSIACGSAMECAAIIDACCALSIIEVARAPEAEQLLLSTIRMLSKMCRP